MPVKITGLKQLKKDLKNLGEKKARNILVAGLRAGSADIAKQMKTYVPTDEGNLKRSIGVQRRRTPKTFIKFSVGPQVNKLVKVKGEQKTLNQADYAQNVEYGTQFQASQPYARNTFDQLGQSVADAISNKIAQRITKEANKV